MTEQIQEAPPRRRLDLLDYLRFAAAGLVLCYHYLFFGITNNNIAISLGPLAGVAKYGYLGVDLFFLISGFVIMNSARNKSASDFVVSRATRLYPAFWPAMILTAAAIAVAGDRVGLTASVRQVVVNLSMAPALLGSPEIDGVYWTLLYELEFYGLVFLLLLTRQGRRLGTLMPLWALAMFGVAVMAPTLATKPLLGGFFAYFAVGAIIAEIRHDGRWTPLRAVGLAAGLFVMVRWAREFARFVTDETDTEIAPWIVSAVVILWTMLIASMLTSSVSNLSLPGASALGDLTYPLYLLHANLGYIVMSFWIDDSNRWIVYPVTMVLAVAAAAALHQVERLRFWRRLFAATLGRAVRSLEPTHSSS